MEENEKVTEEITIEETIEINTDEPTEDRINNDLENLEENQNSNNKTNKILIIVIIVLAIIVIGLLIYFLLIKKPDETNETVVPENNTKEETKPEENRTDENNTIEENSTSEDTNISSKGIISDYVCKGIEQDDDTEAYEENDITLEIFNNNKDQFTLLFKYEDYEVYKDNCGSDNGKEAVCKHSGNDFYYVINTKDKILYNTFGENSWEGSKTNYYYQLVNPEVDEDYNRPLLNLKYKNIIDGYNVLSCEFHSDTQFNICTKSDTVIGYNTVDPTKGAYDSGTKYGLISLEDKSEILKPVYNYISEDSNGHFLVEKDNKMGLYSSSGKELLKLEYDYIGYNEYLGYITIKGENIKIFDNNIKEVKIEDNTIADAYTNILKSHNKCIQSMVDTEAKNSLNLENPNSYLWNSGSIITKQDVSEPYFDSFLDVEEDSYRFKYTGKTYTGEKLIIYDIRGGCTDKPTMYILEGTKAHKISAKEINIPKNSDGNPKAFCF